MKQPLTIVNLPVATYECTYGRGCDGVCCSEGRPLVYAEEIERLQANLHKFLPLLRPEARARIGRAGFLTLRRRLGERVARAVNGWCVFFNQGCVLHKVGAAEGDKFRYKPCVCSLFPIQADGKGNWYVRQRGYQGEKWDLFCLDPKNSATPAADSLPEEIALAQRFEDEYRAVASANTPGSS